MGLGKNFSGLDPENPSSFEVYFFFGELPSYHFGELEILIILDRYVT